MNRTLWWFALCGLVEVRRAAATGLGLLPWGTDPDAGDAAAESLRRGGDAEAANGVEELLGRLSAQRAAALERPLREVCFALGRTLARERDKSVRAAAVLSLGRIAKARPCPMAVHLLLADLAHTNDLREYDLLALAISADPRALRACLDALRSRATPPTTRAAAAVGLGLLGDPASKPILEGLLKTDVNPQVRAFIGVALGMLHDDAALPLLRDEFRTAADLDTRANFAIALGLLGSTGDAHTIVAALGRGGDPRLLWNYTEALRLLGDAGATKELLALAEDPGSEVAADAIRALAATLVRNDGGKPASAAAFDHIHGADYLLAYVVDP